MCDTNEIPHACVEPRTGAKKVTALPVDWCSDEKPKQRYILPGINTRIYYVNNAKKSVLYFLHGIY